MTGKPFNIPGPRRHPGAWLIAASIMLMALEVAVAPFSAATLDTARDLHWASQIASGDAFPAIGPRIADRFDLGPAWFYLLSLPLLMGTGASGAAMFVAFCSSLKYPLALWLGTRLGERRLGIAWMAALALPSLAWYTQATWTHVSLALTSVLVFGIALRADWLRATPLSALALGASIALMLHAHPTLIGLAAPAIWTWARSSGRMLRAFLLAVPVLVSMAPVLAVHATTGGDALTAMLVPTPDRPVDLLATLPTLFVQTFIYAAGAAIRLATGVLPEDALPVVALPIAAFTACATLTGMVGLAIAIRTNPDKRCLAMFTALLLTFELVFVAALRPFTWWYMMLGCLPPAALLIALGWTALPNRILAIVVAGSLLAPAILTAGLIGSAGADTPRYFPVGFQDLKQTAEQRRAGRSPWLPMYAQDRLARSFCRKGGVLLNGTLGFLFDPTGHMLHRIHCPERPEWRLGGRGLQQPSGHGEFALAADIPGLRPTAVAYGLHHYAVVQMLAPPRAPALARASDEKLRGWSAGQLVTRDLRFRVPASSRIAISNPYHWQARLDILDVRIDQREARLVATDGVTHVYAVDPAQAADRDEVVEYRVRLRHPRSRPPNIVIPGPPAPGESARD